MKKIFLGIAFITSSFIGLSQNLIDNADFELGTAINLVGTPFAFTNNLPGWTTGCTANNFNNLGGSPDLYDANATQCQFGVPSNKWAINRTVHIPGTTRYVGMSSNESILGTINKDLSECLYRFKLDYAPMQGYSYCSGNYTEYNFSVNTFIEVVLRNSSNPCSSGEVVFSKPITLNAGVNQGWQTLIGGFTLTSAQVAANYDRIEIRLDHQPGVIGGGSAIFIDNVELTKRQCSTADIEPLNEIGSTVSDSYYGPLEIARFCENDVLVDGSGSVLESAYILEVEEFNINTWTSIGQNYTTSWVPSQVPGSIDLETLFGITFQIGKVYRVKLSVGTNWDSDFMFFVVEECCPDELELGVNCDEGIVEILNLPSGISDGFTTWSHSKQMGVSGGSSQIIQQGNGVVSSIPTAFGDGWYHVNVTFIMPNGMECSYNSSIYWERDICCEIQGPEFEAIMTRQSIIGYADVVAIPYGPQHLPVVSCEGVKVFLETSCYEEEPSSFYVALTTFDPVNWVSTGTVYSSGSYNPSNYPFISTASFSTLQSSTWYMLAICEGNDCSWLVFKTTNCDTKGGKRLLSNETFSDVSIYPNPTSGLATVQLDEEMSGELVVRSIEGKVVFSENFIDEFQIHFDMTKFPGGTYFVEVKNENRVITKKLIKK